MPPETPLPVQVYNTQTRRKEPFEPLEPGLVRIYNCGPTVYDSFHVGNARNFVAADLVRRGLEFAGYRVTFVQNITDIDDKIIQRAQTEGKDTREIVRHYTQVFFEASAALGVRPADHHPRATEYVEKMIELIRRLEEKDLAYAAGGDVFFRVNRFQGYGKLSGRRTEELKSGARVEANSSKEDPLDFVLWKAAKPGEPKWESPWGEGRPGWHLECSTMSMDLLGESFDIHMGGQDLCFPHHENEIAQSEGATGKPFVRYWLHNGFLNINQEKMSKSLGNFFTIEEVLARFPAPVLRYFLMSAHYRAPLDFNDGALEEARTALGRLREARAGARRALEALQNPEPDTDAEPVRTLREEFTAAITDDFNSPRALAALFNAAAAVNRLVHRHESDRELPAAEAATLAGLLAELERLGGEVLGLDLEAGETGLDDLAEKLIGLCIELRAEARKDKNFSLADRIRDGLGEMGVELLDRPQGTEWRRR